MNDDVRSEIEELLNTMAEITNRKSAQTKATKEEMEEE